MYVIAFFNSCFMKFGVYPNLTKDYILKRITQEQIMERYLTIPVILDELVKSPLRNDTTPTCSFYYNQHGRLRFRDFSGHFWGDCFDVVAFRLGVGTTKKDFAFILHTIAKDFKIHKYENESAITEYNLKTDFFFKKKKFKNPTVFKIIFREIDNYDRRYWNSINVSEKLLKQGRVYFAQEIFISKDGLPFVSIYRYISSDPAYCYYGGKYPNGVLKWKIYFPVRKQKGDIGFLSNSSFLQARPLITCGRVCIITKSMKDALVFHSIGLQAVAPSAESVLITSNEYWFLRTKFDFIISCMDFDYAGIKMANQLKRIYRIKPIMFTNGTFNTKDYKAKDASDYVKDFGINSFKHIIKDIYSQYKYDFYSIDKTNYNLLKNIK